MWIKARKRKRKEGIPVENGQRILVLNRKRAEKINKFIFVFYLLILSSLKEPANFARNPWSQVVLVTNEVTH